MRSASLLAALIALGTTLVNGKVYDSLQELPLGEQDYDFIVVGSGPGGATVASRLTENPKVKVLLIEAGPNNEGVLEIAVPPLYLGSINSTYNWNYFSTPQVAMNNKRMFYSRGRVLGGSSSINGMIYTRGPADDFNLWANVSGDPGWSWDALTPYIRKNERLVPPPGGRDATGQYDPAVHGFNGTVAVSLPWSAPNEFDARCIRKTELDPEFSFNPDFNSGNPLGVGWIPRTINDGVRDSAATSYLRNEVRQRPNLTILLNTYALRVLQTGKGKKDFRTLEIGVRYSPQTRKLTASKEVILSGGSFGTPQILLNSGIGSKNELQQIGVASTHDLPDVGKGMTDHIVTRQFFTTNGEVITPPFNFNDAMAEWKSSHTGPLSEPTPDHQFVWARFPDTSKLWEKYADPSHGPNTPHVELILNGTTTGLVGAVVVLMTPYSTGSVKINSTNAYEDPLIDFGFLTNEFDIEALKEGVRLTKRFFSGPAWEGFVGNAIGPDPDADPEAFVANLRATSFGVFHPVGTAVISPKGSKNGVVDPDLKVKGVTGLRVIDASIIPYVPASHTQIPVYILAERAADLVKRAWRI